MYDKGLVVFSERLVKKVKIFSLTVNEYTGSSIEEPPQPASSFGNKSFTLSQNWL